MQRDTDKQAGVLCKWVRRKSYREKDRLEDYIDLRLIEFEIGWSDLLTVHIVSVSDYGPSLCSHTKLLELWSSVSPDVWWLYIQRMELWGSMSENGRPSGIRRGTSGAYQSLNLSLSPEELRKLQRCLRSTDFLSASSRLSLWLSVAGRGKVRACRGHRKHENLSLRWEPCSCFSPDTLDLLALWF